MLKGILLILCLCGTVAYAADAPSAGSGAAGDTPSEASIKKLLETAQVHKLLDSIMAQMDSLMKQSIQQATQGQKVPPKVQKDIEKRQAEMMAMLKDMLDWKKLEP